MVDCRIREVAGLTGFTAEKTTDRERRCYGNKISGHDKEMTLLMVSQSEVQLCLDVSITEISLSLASINSKQDK